MSNILTFPNTKQKVSSKSCGPICLANIYDYLKINVGLKKILTDLKIENKTTTYVPQLALHLKSQGLNTTLISSTPYIVSPSWFNKSNLIIVERLEKYITFNKKNKWEKTIKYLITYLKNDGNLRIIDLTTKIIDHYLDDGYLIVCCLEESWIWGERKVKVIVKFDDVLGAPRGHFIVLYGKDKSDYFVSDPYPTGLKNRDGLYKLNKDKLLVATLVWSGQIIAVKK